DLSTKVNTVTQTATETKNELANVSKTVDSQSAKINTISNTVDGTKQTISDIQTEQGKQSGSIATLKSRADGFEATVTKVDNLSVGGTNLVSGTNQEYQMGFGIPKTTWQDGYAYLKLPTNVINGEILPQSPHTFSYTLVQGTTYTQTIWFETNATVKDLSVAQITWYTGAGHDFQPAKIQKLGQNSYKVVSTYTWPGKTDNNVRLFDIKQLDLAFNLSTGTYLKFGKLKLEKGNLPTDWTPAPEDLSGATAKAQLTADKANLDLSKYKTDADGRISKAQSDITATSKEVKTKVSQSDFDTKTGDLTTKYGQVKATADSVTTDVAKYKKSNDKKVSTNSASIKTLSGQITSKVSQTDFDKTTGDLNGKFTQQKQTVDSISQTVTELQAKANSQGQVNQLMNTEFSPDLEGWTTDSTDGSKVPYRSYARGGVGSITVGFNSTSASTGSSIRLIQTVMLADGTGRTISLRWLARTLQDDNYDNVRLLFRDADNKDISDAYRQWADTTMDGKWHDIKWENIEAPDDAVTVTLYFQAREGTRAYLNQPMLVFDKTIGDYVQGNYNNNNRVAELEVGRSEEHTSEL